MRLVWVVIPLMFFGIGVQEGFSSCVKAPCFDEVLDPLVDANKSFELQKSIKEAVFESEKIHVRILDIEDSRCPSDVQCIWEGQVIVNVNLIVDLEDFGNYDISLNDPLDLSIIHFDQYYLQLIKVKPYPASTESIQDTDYVVTMKFSKIEIPSPLKQIKSGIAPDDIKCDESLVLVIRSNNSPACVKEKTTEIFEERGLGSIPPPCCKPTMVSLATNFEECIAEGNPSMESYPRQCRTLDGKHFVESIPEHKECEISGGLWGIWGNSQSAKESCNQSTSDEGMKCSDSSQCQSFCQAKEGSEINNEYIGMCYGYELAICMQEVRNNVAQNEWCQ